VIDSQIQHCTTGQYSPAVGCVQSIVLRGHVYTGPPLEFPVEKVFESVPLDLAPGAFDLTALELHEWNDIFWESFLGLE